MLILLTGTNPDGLKRLPRRQMTFQYLSEACSEIGMDMVLTTPERVDIKRRAVRGWSLNKATKKWRACECSLAGVMYDNMYLADLKTYKARYPRLITKLGTTDVRVFNPKIPGKDTLHNLLRSPLGLPDHARHELVPKTYVQVDERFVVQTLGERERPFWFKPIHGSGGRNMLFIAPETSGRFAVRGERFYGRHIQESWSANKLTRELRRALEQYPYLLQEDVQLLSTEEGRKVDFRVTLARGSQGIWAVTGITARFGKKGHALTNYHAGGSIQSITELDAKALSMLDGIGLNESDLGRVVNASLQAAERISTAYPNVGILGIDVGVSNEEKRPYVYDCNSRPGKDILTDREIERTMTQVALFGQYLLNRPIYQ